MITISLINFGIIVLIFFIVGFCAGLAAMLLGGES